MLLETCLESEEDRGVPSRMWALQEVRSLVCSYLHQVFIADTALAKLVHFQVGSNKIYYSKFPLAETFLSFSFDISIVLELYVVFACIK